MAFVCILGDEPRAMTLVARAPCGAFAGRFQRSRYFIWVVILRILQFAIIWSNFDWHDMYWCHLNPTASEFRNIHALFTYNLLTVPIHVQYLFGLFFVSVYYIYIFIYSISFTCQLIKLKLMNYYCIICVRIINNLRNKCH